MVARKFAVLCVLLALCAYVNAHAELVVPLGWNPNPSKTMPCGGGAPGTVAQSTWIAFTQAAVQWTVVAGDGVGPVTALLDPTGGTTFANVSNYVTLFTGQPSLTVAPQTFFFPVPNVTCTGKGGLCTVQVFSSSGWYACSTVAILPPCDNCTAPPPPPPVCLKATGMTFCTMMNDKNVEVPSGYSAAAIDIDTETTYISYLANKNVFSNGNDATCKSDYMTFLCALKTPPCAGSNGQAIGAACHSMCQAAMSACQLNATHTALYPCSTYPLCPGESADAHTITPMLFLIGALLSFGLLL